MTRTYFEKLSQDYTQLLESGYDYNVIIEVGESSNNLFKAHSAILYQRSKYFQQKLTNATKKNNITEIRLPHLSTKAFSMIIKYIYSGIISLENFEVSEIFDLLIIVNEFMLVELVEYLQPTLRWNYSSWLYSNFSRVYHISFLNGNFLSLQNFCDDSLNKYPDKIINCDDFINLDEDALTTILMNDDIQTEEIEIWDKVIQWGKAKTPNLPSNLEEWTDENFKSLKSSLRNCLPHIKYFRFFKEDIPKIDPYRNILETYIWNDLVIKHLDPEMPIISPFSSIITMQHVAEISSWIDRRSTTYEISEIPYEFDLLLRGSRDGFSGETFHRLCDYIPGTVVIIKIHGTNEIVGGYNPLIWKVGDSNDEDAETTDSFIFSLKNENLSESILSRVNDPSMAIWYGEIDQGPWFSGYDFGINSKNSCCCNNNYNVPYAYEKLITSEDGCFSADEFEVFQICKLDKFDDETTCTVYMEH
ncbi:hypothetical protein C2G38_2153923 [Gigaspora rosea]|uniref:TLD-domain-containing protein n=1 Tax=Gigaspora rosea TaxID=44941 RepID=A0A397W9B5_9GLOM|nr:hypothetical protein C2G38_2153923 [Gigaspora rosea]